MYPSQLGQSHPCPGRQGRRDHCPQRLHAISRAGTLAKGAVMQPETIAQAVTMLRQQGKRVSVRTVHALTGGSLRDVWRLMRTLPPTEETPMTQTVPATTPEPPSTPAATAPLGQIAQARQ